MLMMPNDIVVVSVSFKLCRQSCGDNANIGIFRGAIVALAVDDSEHIMNDTYREKTQFIIAMVDIEIFKAQLIVEYMRATSKEIPCFLIFFAFLFSSHTKLKWSVE